MDQVSWHDRQKLRHPSAPVLSLQDAFRSLLSAPRASGSGTTSTSKSVLGGGKPKQGWGLRPKPGKKYDTPRSEDNKDAVPPEDSTDGGGSGESSRPEMAPRMYHKQLLKEKGYKDRAEMRRLGENDEYQGVQKLLDDFERRKKAAEDAGEDTEEVRRPVVVEATALTRRCRLRNEGRT